MIRQRAFTNDNIKYRVVGKLENADKIMMSIFWIGVWPGVDARMISNVVEKVRNYING